MTTSTYIAISAALRIGVVLAFAAMFVSLVFVIVRWRTPQRRGHFYRVVIAFAAIPIFVGINWAIVWRSVLERERQQIAEINEASAKRFDDTTFVQIGDTVPPCSIKTIDGLTVTLPMPGKVVLINFFATWCGPCQLELPHMEQILSELKNEDHFRLAVVGREETPETVRDFRQQHCYSFPIAADTKRVFYSLFAKE